MPDPSLEKAIKLPFIQPDRDVICEVARFLKAHIGQNDRLLNCHPTTVNRWWIGIAEDCGFRYIHPHGWKHSYATNGAANLAKWYGGNVYNLQKCCLHESYQTTEKYIHQKADSFLKSFESI